jgi:outer membrane protein assembly factor BamB
MHRHHRMTRSNLLAAVPAAWLLSAAAPATATATKTIDWPTFGLNFHRNNYNPFETVLSNNNVGGMQQLWRADLGAETRYQPSLVRAVVTPSGTLDLLLVTLPGGTVTALNAATGASVWATSFPTVTITCKGSSLTTGIGEPATIDVRKGLVFVVDAGGNLHALSLATGAEMPGYPVEVIDAANLAADTWVHYASPTLMGDSVYVETAVVAICESASTPYHGQVIRFDTSSLSVVTRYYPMGDGAMLGGGFWGPGGLALDENGSYLWGATANSLPPPQDGGNAEKIVQLDRKLNLVAVDGPQLNSGSDLDFGSTPLLFTPAGCPEMLAAMNKSGVLVVYNTENFTAGPVQILQITAGGGSSKFIGMPSFDPVTNTVYVSNPLDSADGTYLHGLIALQASAACQLSLLWQQTVGENGDKSPAITPVVANGVIYYNEAYSRLLAAFDAVTGAPLWTSAALAGASSAPPIVVNGVVYVGAGKSVYAFGLKN